ncbi:MAG TPA: hypothetical protein VK741_11075 [Acetobacteraceae bacterium]|nr:hypothetical protein [Acetobacteraceae bacterium]
MSGSTWTWLGNTTAWAVASNWSLTQGDTGNPNNYPAPGDTALLNSGTVQPLVITGAQTSDNSIDLSGGAVLDFSNGSTLDGGSAVNSSDGTVDVSGVFTLLGSLGVVDATATLTVAIDGTLVSNGTSNDIGINDGQAGALNSGTLVITGGTVEAEGIHINDGIAIVSTALDASDEVSITGGSVEVDLTTAGAPALQFVAATVGSTIKLDDPTFFEDGSLQGFATGATLDIGANVIGTIIYSGDLGGYADLTVENSSGSTLLSAVISGGDESAFQAGTFTVGASGGTAGSFQVTQGSGDTLITEAGATSPGPVVNAGGSVSYTAGGTPAALDSGLAVSDSEATTLTGATVVISSGFLAGDILAAAASEPDISVSYNSGTLTLTGTDTLADYQAVLDSITYASSAADPTSGGADDGRGISWMVNDGTNTGTGSSSLSVSTPATGPLVTAGGSASYNAGSSPATLDAGLTISDAESPTLDSATVAITSGFLAGDTLSVASADGISASYDASSGTLTLSGAASLSDYQTVLDSVTYSSSAGDPTDAGTDFSRTIGWVVNDGTASSTASTSSLTVSASVGTASNAGILFQNTSGQMDEWQLTGTVISSAGYLGPDPGSSWFAMASGGFFAGDSSDIAYQNEDGQVALWQVSGGTVEAGYILSADPGSSWHIAGSGDFYGDGKSDLLWQNTSGQVAVWEMTGTTISQWSYVASPGPSWNVEGTGNFYGDGNTDILLQNDNGAVAVWDIANGTSIVNAGTIADPGPSWRVEGTGDFYSDGNTDVLLQNSDGAVAIWDVANGTTITQASVIANPGPTWHVVGAGEFTGGNTPDILLQNENGSVAVWEVNDGTIAAASVLANPGTSWSVTGSDTMRFIYSGSAGETLAATPTTPEEFVFTSAAAGEHTITGFTPMLDTIELNGGQFSSFAAVEAATSATQAGAMINLENGASLLLAGVEPGSLNANNFALT